REREWLILSSEHILGTGQLDDKEEAGETVEELLESTCLGLHEMIVTEWPGGECHLAVDYPIVPAKSLVHTVARLREAVSLGRAFHVGSNIHMWWKLQLERILQRIPENER